MRPLVHGHLRRGRGADACLSRMAITRGVDIEMAGTHPLRMQRTQEGAGQGGPAVGDEQVPGRAGRPSWFHLDEGTAGSLRRFRIRGGATP
jgi:hypothetical protein